MRFPLALGCIATLNLILACGGGGSSSPPPGNLTLRLGSDSIPGYTSAVVSLREVDASGDGNLWVNLGAAPATYDLMALQNGNSVALVSGVSVGSGTYKFFRFTWDTVNHANPINLPAYAVDSLGGQHALAMPTSPTVVTGAVTLLPNGSATAQVMFSGNQAIQVRPGATGPVTTFQATGQAFDLGQCATITGNLGAGGLNGAEAFAETVNGALVATIQRRVFTGSSGNYTLEALPTGSIYFVVSQPAGTTSAYAAAASAGVDCASAISYGPVDLAFASPQSPGALALAITPPSAATVGTWGELRQSVATGTAGFQALIVRSQTVATGAAQDVASFAGLFPGNYGCTAQRSTAGAAPVMAVGTQIPVLAGATANGSITYAQ